MLFLKEIREVLLSFLYLGLGSFTVSKETLVCGVDLVPYLYPFSIGGTMELALLRPPGLQEIMRLLFGPLRSLWFPFLLFILWACCPDPTRLELELLYGLLATTCDGVCSIGLIFLWKCENKMKKRTFSKYSIYDQSLKTGNAEIWYVYHVQGSGYLHQI